MLKKFKILMAIIILSLTGIIVVISIWLYGNYSNHLEIAVVDVERSLFNSVQSYYDTHANRTKSDYNDKGRNFDSSDFIKALKESYSNIDSTRVSQIIDSILNERFGHKETKEQKIQSSSTNRYVVPSLMSLDIDFDLNTISGIDSLLDFSLKERGMTFSVDVVLEKIDYQPRKFRTKTNVDSLGFINTRPILINPESNEFIRAKFEEPVSYVLSKMFWQLVVVFLLIIGLIGTFIYLFWTINRQNRLAILRKSFVNNMTHELKTPVATVTAAIEAIQRYGARNDKIKMEKYLQISQNELLHLSNMIEKVLQLDVGEVSGIVIERHQLDLIPLLNEVVELGKLASKKQMKIDIEVNQAELIINGDVAHLKNLFNNLLDNAIKYSHDSVWVQVKLLRKVNHVEIEIKDNGIGIPSQYMKSIFDMFFRVPNGDLYPVKGFGLGLSYVKQVVEKHGGTIEVKSELNKGTVFTIKLPQ